MATLAFNHEEIAARELKPELLEMDGISRASVEAHYKLYEGYVTKRNEILTKLDGVDLASANQVYSELRALKLDLTFAVGGIKNHETYFEQLGGEARVERGVELVEPGDPGADDQDVDIGRSAHGRDCTDRSSLWPCLRRCAFIRSTTTCSS